MPYCENCGKPVNPNAKFCRNCCVPQTYQAQQPLNSAAPTQVNSPPQPIPEPARQEAAEQIFGFIIVSRSKRFGSQEYFTGILTNNRFIFAPMTNNMLKEVADISKQQAKGKIGPMATYPYQQNYLAAGPYAIMVQTPGCFAIDNASIRAVNLTLVNAVSDGYSDFQEFQMQVITDASTQTFRMTKRDEYLARLKQVYLDKVKLLTNFR